MFSPVKDVYNTEQNWKRIRMMDKHGVIVYDAEVKEMQLLRDTNPCDDYCRVLHLKEYLKYVVFEVVPSERQNEGDLAYDFTDINIYMCVCVYMYICIYANETTER